LLAGLRFPCSAPLSTTLWLVAENRCSDGMSICHRLVTG
jgi:hypothetical protein